MPQAMPKTREYKNKICEKYFDMIYRLALSRTKDIHHAEDVTGEVFLKYIESTKDFETEEHIKAWLIRVTVNSSKSLFSGSWMQKTVGLSDELCEMLTENMKEDESSVYEEVLKLPEKYRLVIHLYYYEELSCKEIASCLKIKETTVRSQLKRAREMLKITMEGDDERVW